MTLPMYEYAEVEKTIRRIKARIDRHQSVRLIVVGGRSGPMPFVALVLKLAVPRIRIEIRNHHRARAVNGGPLGAVRVIRP